MFSSLVVLASLSPAVLANVFLTSPVGSTTFTAGQQATITWQDDGKTPALKDFGPAKIGIFTGNANQQTQLQQIVPSVDVSTTSSVQFTPDGTIGPNGNDYFVRVESLNLKDATTPQFPALAFSAKFTMAGMTGTFNDTVQQQIAGQSTAPIGGQTSAASGATTAATAGATSSNKSAAGAAAKTSSVSASASAKPNSASTLLGQTTSKWLGLGVAALLGVSVF